VAPRAWDRTEARGAYRRRIRCVNDPDEPGRSYGELEDDFHHFRVEIDHADGVITDVRGSGVRGPWTACMDAGVKLLPLIGQPLSWRSTAVGDYAEARQNCTHMFDLAGLLVAHATRTETVRQYDLEVTDRAGDPAECDALIWRDGELALNWHLVADEIATPADWVGAPIHKKFIAWAESNLERDKAEAAIALKRIINISIGRAVIDLDRHDNAGDIGPQMHQRCHTYQPGVAEVALRVRGTGRDFTDHPEVLLADMHLR
jgi:hypothetical protein